MAMSTNMDQIFPTSTAINAVEAGLEEMTSFLGYTERSDMDSLLHEENNMNDETMTLNFTTENSIDFDFFGSVTSSTLNTPDITEHENIDEIFSKLLDEEDSNEPQLKEQEIGTLDNDFDLFTNQHIITNPMDLIPSPKVEEVWAMETFDDEMLGVCLPAAEVEGRLEPLDEKKDDLLKSLIDDHQINNLASFDITETEISNITNFEPLTNSRITIEIIDESNLPLKEEGKYRKMRSQNNEASRKCRANRKRKLVDMEQESEELEERNKHLREKLANMEVEVASYKKKLLLDISNKSVGSVNPFIGMF